MVCRMKQMKYVMPTETIIIVGDGKGHSRQLYYRMLNASIMTSGRQRRRVTQEDMIEKLRLRIEKGTDVSGHIILASRLPILHIALYLEMLTSNLAGVYSGVGIYDSWGSLPYGKWHSRQDYIVGIEFGVSQLTRSEGPNARAIHMLSLMHGFIKYGLKDPEDMASYRDVSGYTALFSDETLLSYVQKCLRS